MKPFLLFLIAFTLWAIHGAYHAGEFLGVKTPFGVFNDSFPYSNEVHFIIESVIGIALVAGLIGSYQHTVDVKRDSEVKEEFFNESNL